MIFGAIKNVFLNVIPGWDLNWSRISSMSLQWSKKKKVRYGLVEGWWKIFEDLLKVKKCFLAKRLVLQSPTAPTALCGSLLARMTYSHKFLLVGTLAMLSLEHKGCRPKFTDALSIFPSFPLLSLFLLWGLCLPLNQGLSTFLGSSKQCLLFFFFF